MTKHHRPSDGGDGEPTSSPSSNGSGSSPASAVPVQVTNVVQIITEHLPAEYAALRIHIEKLHEQVSAADKYRQQLERIAADAGVVLSGTP